MVGFSPRSSGGRLQQQAGVGFSPQSSGGSIQQQVGLGTSFESHGAARLGSWVVLGACISSGTCLQKQC